MGFYARHVLPHCLDFTCGLKPIQKQRAKIIPKARGKVVEIGMGSCRNLPFYDAAQVSQIIGVEPDAYIWKRGAALRQTCAIPITHLDLEGEKLPLGDGLADSIVVTYALCTIADPVAALKEMRRVLKPDGQILFCEHGKAPDPVVARWQRRIDPVWKRIAGGCHSGRDIPALMTQAGLKITTLEALYIPGPKVLGFNYWGTAQ